MKIGERIRQRRNELGMSQEKLAELVFVSTQAVSLWETNKTVPSVYNFGRIARALKMKKEDLISDEVRNIPSWVVNDQFFSEKNMYRKLEEFADREDLRQTKRAIFFAYEQHKDLKRKKNLISGEEGPAILHPFTMACHAHAIGIRDDIVLATALLHDVCEDCGVSVKGLPFSEEVKEAVGLLTKTDGVDDDSYYAGIARNSTAAIVKVMDRCNNISTMMTAFPEDKIIQYVEETEQYVLPLIEYIKKEYTQYYDQVFILKYQMKGILESIKAAILRL